MFFFLNRVPVSLPFQDVFSWFFIILGTKVETKAEVPNCVLQLARFNKAHSNAVPDPKVALYSLALHQQESFQIKLTLPAEEGTRGASHALPEPGSSHHRGNVSTPCIKASKHF